MNTEANRRSCRKYRQRQRALYPDKVRARDRERSKKYKDTIKRWRQKHPDKVNAYLRAYRKRIREANPEKVKAKKRESRLRSSYGLSMEAWQIMYESQHGRCMICNEHADKLFVDHDHQSGKTRSLLCIHCNTALGHVRESERIALSLADYIRNVC
jgi:transketolase